MDELILDPFHLEADDRAFIISTAEQYVEVRCKIRALARAAEPVRLIVREVSLWEWFDDLRLDAAIAVRTRDPVQELIGALHEADLPPWLKSSPTLIAEWKLIEKALTRPAQQSVDDWIRAVCVGPFWSRSSMTIDDIPALLGAAHDLMWEQLHIRLRELVMEKVSSWSAVDQLTPFVQWLCGGDLQRRARAFDLAQRLIKYPFERVSTWLTPHGLNELMYLQDWQRWAIRVPMSQIADTAVPHQIRSAVATYIIENVGAHPEHLAAVCRQASGRIPSEISAFRQVFTSWTAPVSHDIIEILGKLFPGHPVVDLACEYVEVSAPLPFPHRASPNAVVEWVLGSYLPFYRWSRVVQRPELTVAHVAEFEQWYLAQGGLLDPIEWSIHGLIDYAESISHPGVLVVVIDGLGAEWITDLLRELQHFDLHSTGAVGVRFSILPSITEYAKPALIRGQQPRQIGNYDSSTNGYRQLLEARLPGMNVEVISEVDRAIDLVGLVGRRQPGDKNVYLYLANRLDHILHSPASERQRRNRAQDYLREICQQVKAACEHYSDVWNRKLTVILTADHGHTVLPQAAEELSIPEGGQETHSRAVKLPQGSQATLPGTWMLPPEQWGLSEPFIVAAGYRYFGNRPRGTVHGGVLPEEMLVPVATVQLGPVQHVDVADPFFAHLGRVLANRPSVSVTLGLENPNAVPVNITMLNVDRLTGIPPFIQVPARRRVEVPVQLDSRGLRAGMVNLNARFSLHCQDRESQGRTGLVTVEVRSPALQSTLDDLL